MSNAIFDIARYVHEQFLEVRPAVLPMDLSLTFFAPTGGSMTGDSGGGLVVAFGGSDVLAWAWAKPRRPFSRDPYVIELRACRSHEELDAAPLLGEYRLGEPGSFELEAVVEGQRHTVLAQIDDTGYSRALLERTLATPKLVLACVAPADPEQEPFETWPSPEGCGMRVGAEAPDGSCVWAWQSGRAVGESSPTVLRLVLIERRGVPTGAEADAAPVLAELVLERPERLLDAAGSLEATHEGRRYEVRVELEGFTRGAMLWVAEHGLPDESDD